MSKQILIIEDEPAIRRTVALLLRGMGYETLTAPDAPSAWRLLEHTHPDVILTDERLPGQTGSQIVDAIRERDDLAQTPIVIMSAYDEPRGHNANDFIAKPFDPDALEQILSRYTSENGN